MSKLKDGAAFVALEYANSLKVKPRYNKHGQLIKPAAIVPVGIVYTDKTKYRSEVLVRFGKPIQMAYYVADFEKTPKTTAKAVTKALEDALLSLTVNSPDWLSRKSAAMAREMLFPAEYGDMTDFVQVSQR
ncbi:hypothetical protein BD408DRAFT_465919 [Parasitella parasitica]|nr:hypothetical protein BD408DRAFT_465919 [Parasitella parasitica]